MNVVFVTKIRKCCRDKMEEIGFQTFPKCLFYDIYLISKAELKRDISKSLDFLWPNEISILNHLDGRHLAE